MQVLSQKLESLVGLRFETTEKLEEWLKHNFDAESPSVSENEDDEDDEIEGTDFRLDCALDTLSEIGEYNDFELFYLKDRQGNYYITEINAWGIVD